MGMKWKSAVVSSAVVLVASAQFALADDAPAAATATNTTTQSKSLMENLADHYALTYWGNYNGPSVGNNNVYNPLPNGENATGQYLDSLITASYKLNPNLLLGVAQEFYYRPVLGQDMTLLDPAVRLQALNVINTSNWNLKLEGWAYAPVTSASRANNEITGFKFVQNLNFTYGALTVGSYSYVRQYVYSATSPGVVEDRRFYEAPNGSFALTKTVQASMWVDLGQYMHNRGDTSFFPSQGNYPWDVEPGFNWDITPNLSFNPYVNIFPNNPTLASTYVGFILVGKAI